MYTFCVAGRPWGRAGAGWELVGPLGGLAIEACAVRRHTSPFHPPPSGAPGPPAPPGRALPSPLYTRFRVARLRFRHSRRNFFGRLAALKIPTSMQMNPA